MALTKARQKQLLDVLQLKFPHKKIASFSTYAEGTTFTLFFQTPKKKMSNYDQEDSSELLQLPFRDTAFFRTCCGVLEIGGFSSTISKEQKASFILWINAPDLDDAPAAFVATTTPRQTSVIAMLKEAEFTPVRGGTNFRTINKITVWVFARTVWR